MAGWDIMADNAGATAIGIASLAGAYASYQEGLTQNIFAEHNALMSEFDAEFARISGEAEGRLIELQTDISLDALRVEERRALATARVKAGASGFALDTGSNQDVQTDINEQTALDAAFIKISSGLDVDLRKLGLELEVSKFKGESDTSRFEGQQAKTRGGINAINTLISGTAKASALLVPKKE